MDRGRPELFCLDSSSLQLSEGCWMLQRDLHRTCHPCHSATLPGDKDMSIHDMETSSGIFETCWFPSHLDGNMFLFLFTFERENLWWAKSLGVQPTSTISLAKPLLQLSWFNSLFFFFQPHLSPVCWFLQMFLWNVCRPTFLTSVQQI